MGKMKVTYILKRLSKMDWKAMIKKINSISKKTGKSKFSIFMDMKECANKYGAGYMDYDLFEMYNLTDKQRDTYLTRGRNNELVVKYCDKDYFHYFENKDNFNERFNDYLKREWIKVNGSEKEKIIDFMERYKIFMAKPINGCCGKGIEKININNYNSLDEIYNKLTEEGCNYELEEIIKQHSELNKMYPDAINTIRVVTIVTTEDGKSLLTVDKEKEKDIKLEPHIISTCFRIGNGKCVDNFNNGGLVVPVDEKTGVISHVAIDKQKNVYENHPITGTPIKGFKIPYWNEILELCKKASLEVPRMGYIGWDVALTPNGPIFVEGNEFPGHDLYQLPIHTPDKIGMMPKYEFEKKAAAKF